MTKAKQLAILALRVEQLTDSVDANTADINTIKQHTQQLQGLVEVMEGLRALGKLCNMLAAITKKGFMVLTFFGAIGAMITTNWDRCAEWIKRFF